MVSATTSLGISALALFVILWATEDEDESDDADDGQPPERADHHDSGVSDE